jgi:hypothetical protein
MKWLSSIAILLFIQTIHAQGNLVQNGSFEEQPYGTGWQPAPNAYLFFNPPDGGVYATDFTRIAQTVATEPGQSYTLSFYLGNDALFKDVGTVQVVWGGVALPPFSTIPRKYNPQINRTEQNAVFEKVTMPGLVASSSRTSLEFDSIQFSQIIIDGIQLIAVPEPSSILLTTCGLVLLAPLLRQRLLAR